MAKICITAITHVIPCRWKVLSFVGGFLFLCLFNVALVNLLIPSMMIPILRDTKDWPGPRQPALSDCLRRKAEQDDFQSPFPVSIIV